MNTTSTISLLLIHLANKTIGTNKNETNLVKTEWPKNYQMSSFAMALESLTWAVESLFFLLKCFVAALSTLFHICVKNDNESIIK